MVSSGMQSETNVEVHKYYGGTVLGAALLALVLQAFLHKYGHWAELVELPLLVTIYFGVSRRNPVSGLFLGAVIGILQDALSHDNPIGLYGIAKTLVGYVASSVGARIDTEHPVSRFGLVFVLFHFHQFVLAVTQRALLARPAPLINLHLFVASLVSATLAVLLFALLDRLRRVS
jgi:rod shape-determining protein MreD